MKKIFAIVLAIVMTLSLVLGCSNEKKGANAAGQQAKVADTAVKGSSSASLNDGKATAKEQEKQSGPQVSPNIKTGSSGSAQTAASASGAKVQVEKGKAYTDKDHVAAYIHVYKTLPPNYITKAQATKLGWKTSGSLDKVAPGKSIGGDRFGNYEKVLPDKQGRTWKECDIDYIRGNRNAKRICYSNDGLIYYSGSHYRDFVRMY